MTDDQPRHDQPRHDQPEDAAPDGADAEDRRRRRVLWKLPSGLYLLGSAAGDRRNLMTISWVSQLATSPRLVGVGVEVGALTHRLVAEGGAFTVNLLRREDRPLVRRFVKPAEDDGGALNGHPVRVEVTGAPVLEAAAAWLDCELRQTVGLGSHTLFVGEVVGAGFGAGEEAEVLRMEDTRMSYGG